MPFPDYPIAADKANRTRAVSDHPAHHNALANAVNDLQDQFDAGIGQADIDSAIAIFSSPRPRNLRYEGADPTGVESVQNLLQQINDEMAADGGGVIETGPGTFLLDGRFTRSNRVSIQGHGTSKYDTDNAPVTTFLCSTAGAGFTLGSRTTGTRGGFFKNFEINGGGIATQPLYVGQLLDPVFEQVRVDNADGEAWLIEACQNGTFTRCSGLNSTGAGLAIDSGAGGLTFLNFSTSSCGGPGVPALHIRETYGDVQYGTVGPSQLNFFGGIFERLTAGQDVLVRHSAGRNIGYYGTNFVSTQATVDHAIVHIDSPVAPATANSFIRYLGCTFSGGATGPTYATGLRTGLGNGLVLVDGLCYFLNLKEGVELVGNNGLYLGALVSGSVTTWLVENGGTESQAVAYEYVAPLSINRPGATYNVLRAKLTTDSSYRWTARADGRQTWGSGSAAGDTTLERFAAGVLGVGLDDCFRTGRAATASRPVAADVGEGAQFFDTTLNKPIWSDGTNWRDAAGSLV